MLTLRQSLISRTLEIRGRALEGAGTAGFGLEKGQSRECFPWERVEELCF